MRLLLAEDEKEMSAALVAILTHSGYEVDAVYDGQAAVDKALSQSYDCMIFDIMMPKKDGVQALKEIREKGNMTPVIMLTAKAEIDDRITGLDAGADDYLTNREPPGAPHPPGRRHGDHTLLNPPQGDSPWFLTRKGEQRGNRPFSIL